MTEGEVIHMRTAEVTEAVVTTCAACGRPVTAEQERMRIRAATYHEECRRAWASMETMPRRVIRR